MARLSKADQLKVQQWKAKRQPMPAKPACSPYECTIFNDTRGVWEKRPKTARALALAGLAPPKATPKTTTTTTPAACSNQASNDEGIAACSPRLSSSSLGPLMAKKPAEPVLFRPVNHDTRVGKRVSYMRTVTPREVARAQERKLFEGVDERLKACRVDQESEWKKEWRARLGQRLARTLTRRGETDNNQWKARGFGGRR